jgi:hypothetical protein
MDMFKRNTLAMLKGKLQAYEQGIIALTEKQIENIEKHIEHIERGE